MKIPFIAAILSLLTVFANNSGAAIAAKEALPPPGFPLITSQWKDGTPFGYYVTLERLSATPPWTFDPLQPPALTLAESSQKASDWVRNKYPTASKLQPLAFSLNRVKHSSVENRWFYMFEYDVSGLPEASAQFLGRLMVLVLLDGTVVEPETTR